MPFTFATILSAVIFILKPLLILLVCRIAINAILNITKNVMGKTSLDLGIQGFVQTAAKIGLWAIVIIFVADSLGINTASLVALLSVVSLALSLSFQNIMTNMFSGIMILLAKPFAVGDFVEVAGISGIVKAISLVRTTIATTDNKIHQIPNGTIESSNITNYSAEPLRRIDITVTASYDAPTETVKKAVLEVANRDERIKKEEGIMPFVRLSNYNANDIEYTIRLWVDNKDYWDVYFDTMESIRESFAQHGVEFSYPHVVVHNN